MVLVLVLVHKVDEYFSRLGQSFLDLESTDRPPSNSAPSFLLHIHTTFTLLLFRPSIDELWLLRNLTHSQLGGKPVRKFHYERTIVRMIYMSKA